MCRDESMSLMRLGHCVDAKVSVRILGTDQLTLCVRCNVSQIGFIHLSGRLRKN